MLKHVAGKYPAVPVVLGTFRVRVPASSDNLSSRTPRARRLSGAVSISNNNSDTTTASHLEGKLHRGRASSRVRACVCCALSYDHSSASPPPHAARAALVSVLPSGWTYPVVAREDHESGFAGVCVT